MLFKTSTPLAKAFEGVAVPQPHLAKGLCQRRPGISHYSVINWGSLAGSLRAKLFGEHSNELELAVRRLENCFSQLVIADTERLDFVCDIGDVEGLEASKSNRVLLEGITLDDLVIPYRRDLLGFHSEHHENQHDDWLPEGVVHQSPEGIAYLLAGGHERKLIGPDSSPNHFTTYDWDGRLFLDNTGRSHRFAAARLIARLIGHSQPLYGTLKRWRLDLPAVQALRTEAYLVVVGQFPSDDSPYDESSFAGIFRTRLARLKTPPLCCWLTCPATRQLVVVISRTEVLADELCKYLLSAGGVDYGSLLAELAFDSEELEYTHPNR